MLDPAVEEKKSGAWFAWGGITSTPKIFFLDNGSRKNNVPFWHLSFRRFLADTYSLAQTWSINFSEVIFFRFLRKTKYAL
ncbi:MAG: hypothetical protein BA872_02030 [Desulfobacterales bacterium C00003060]|nr:MAG: hypothetical protein BA861_12330 [Desulfobacterales bacterium S3730MH5]OEU77072.1 MAG: hypothetical protein BA872_02030 [Desulfobacterales bacterium C00003060]